MAKAATPKKPSLDSVVIDIFKRRGENGAEGLKALVMCIERTARFRDWDALSRFITLAGKTESARGRVAKIVRAAFGNHLTYKSNSKHDTGGTIVMGWEGAFPLSQSNTWGLVRAAAEAGKTWYDPAFLKELPGPTRKLKTVDAAAELKAVKHLAKYLHERESEGFSVGAILAGLQSELAKDKVQSKPVAPVTRSKNGTVIEVPH